MTVQVGGRYLSRCFWQSRLEAEALWTTCERSSFEGCGEPWRWQRQAICTELPISLKWPLRRGAVKGNSGPDGAVGQGISSFFAADRSRLKAFSRCGYRDSADCPLGYGHRQLAVFL